jgi:hypothetical protein
MKFFAHSLAVLALAISLNAQGEQPEPGDSLNIGRLPSASDTDTVAVAPRLRLYDPVLTAGESFVIPGLGQVRTGHYVKAGIFVAMDAIFGSMSYFWGQSAAVDEEYAAYYMAGSHFSVTGDSSRLDSAINVEQAHLQHYNAIVARFSAYDFLTWAIGAHIYNVFDAIDRSNHFRDNEERNPTTAFLLALIPGLGLGQVYNGEWSKAGLTIMGQWGLGMMAFNNERLRVIATNNYVRLNTPLADSAADAIRQQVASTYSNSWSGEEFTAFSNRNMFLWYSIAFYGYSLFDAVVDAYLHDYPNKMKIKPDLAVGPKSVRFSLRTDF